MPVLTRENLWNRHLKLGELAPVYLLFGPETHLRDLAARSIADAAFSEGDLREFNESEFSLNNPDNFTAALSVARQLPMMSARRLVRITDVRISAGGRLDTIKDEHEQTLSEYFANPSESSTVILIADELNGSRKISKLLKEKCLAVEFAKLGEADLIILAGRKIKEAGSEADDSTLRHLVERAGSDASRLANEIAKLSAAALPEKRITVELIDSLVADYREIGQWDLVDHLTSGRASAAVAALKKMLDDGSEPLMILGQIGSSFRRKAIGGHSDPKRMTRIMSRIAKADLAIKNSIGGGGPAGARMQIEMLVCELAVLA